LIEGSANILDKILSVKNPKADVVRMQQRRKGNNQWADMWDGKKHYMDMKSRTFKTGLLYYLDELAKANNIHEEVTWESEQDDSIPHTLKSVEVPADLLYGVTLREYQIDTVKDNLKCYRGISRNATNAGKTEMMAAMIKTISLAYYQGEARALVVVPGKTLVNQTADRFKLRLPEWEDDIGVMGDKQHEHGKMIVVATDSMVHSWLHSKDATKRDAVIDMLCSANIMLMDEAHHGKSSSWIDIANICQASFRYGFSGTPITPAGAMASANVDLVSVTGGQLSYISNKFMIEHGYSAKPIIIMTSVGEDDKKIRCHPVLKDPRPNSSCQVYRGDGVFAHGTLLRRQTKFDTLEDTNKIFKGMTPTQIKVKKTRLRKQKKYQKSTGKSFVKVHGETEVVTSKQLITESYYDVFKMNYEESNRKVMAWAQVFAMCKLPSLMIIRKILHGEMLSYWLSEKGVRNVFLSGGDDTDVRDKAFDQIASGDLDLIIATSIFDEGVDVPDLRGLILNSSGESYTKALQRIGRGVRAKKDGENVVYVVDTVDYQCDFLLQDSLARLDYYDDEEFEVLNDQEGVSTYFEEFTEFLKAEGIEV